VLDNVKDGLKQAKQKRNNVVWVLQNYFQECIIYILLILLTIYLIYYYSNNSNSNSNNSIKNSIKNIIKSFKKYLNFIK